MLASEEKLAKYLAICINICYNSILLGHIVLHGRIPEWPKGTDCKSAANCFGGSNPPPPIRVAKVNGTVLGADVHDFDYNTSAGVAE